MHDGSAKAHLLAGLGGGVEGVVVAVQPVVVGCQSELDVQSVTVDLNMKGANKSWSISDNLEMTAKTHRYNNALSAFN